jgi:hypothetical protein
VNDTTVDRTYEYDAAGNSVENYTLDPANTTTRGIATNAAGTRLWVLDANRKVYIYNNSGVLQGSWTLGTLPTTALVEGIATNGTHLWVVDRSARRVYYYANAASRTSGTQTATANFALNSGNTTPKDVVFGSQSGTNFLWVVDDGTGFDRVFRVSAERIRGFNCQLRLGYQPGKQQPHRNYRRSVQWVHGCLDLRQRL